jgi:hypothetical protein
MNLTIGTTYTFNTLAPSILGAVIQQAKLVSILDYGTAKQYDTIDLKYRSVYPLLPVGTPNQPDSTIYYRFVSQSGEYIIVAEQWIDESSIETIEFVNIQVLFQQASLSDVQRIRNALNALGYSNYTIKTL